MAIEQVIVFLVQVPDSFLRDGKKRQQYKRRFHRGHHWKRLEQCLFLLFSDNLFALAAKQARKAFGKLFFLFLKLVQLNFIFADNVCILSIYPALVLFEQSNPTC